MRNREVRGTGKTEEEMKKEKKRSKKTCMTVFLECDAFRGNFRHQFLHLILFIYFYFGLLRGFFFFFFQENFVFSIFSYFIRP